MVRLRLIKNARLDAGKLHPPVHKWLFIHQQLQLIPPSHKLPHETNLNPIYRPILHGLESILASQAPALGGYNKLSIIYCENPSKQIQFLSMVSQGVVRVQSGNDLIV